MNVRLFFITVGVYTVLSAASLFSQEIDGLLSGVPRALREELYEGGVVERYLEDADDVVLIPDHPLARYIHDALAEVNPTVISEQLVLIPVTIDRRGTLDLFNSLRRVSDLSYLEYRNDRTGRTHYLFEESSAIDGVRSRLVIDDPVVGSLPTDDRVWVLQGVPPFGEIVSEYRYRSDGRAFLFTGSNHDPLPYRGMRVVKPGNMITCILVVPTDEFVLMYGLGGVRAFMLFGLLDDRIEAAFSGRTDGIFSWYSQTYLATLE